MMEAWFRESRNDLILFRNRGSKNSSVPIKAGGIEDGILSSQGIRQFLLKGLVQIGGTTDKPDGRHAVTMRFQRICLAANINAGWLGSPR